LFYVLLPGSRAALLDGMTKKRDDIPDAMVKRQCDDSAIIPTSNGHAGRFTF
jgi:hypothetical protein